MKRIKMALVVGEKEYGRRLMTTILSHYRKQIELHLYFEDYSWIEKILDFKSDNIDMDYDLLVCGDLTQQKFEEIPWEKLKAKMPILVLRDGEENPELYESLEEELGEGGFTCVEKYQEVSQIVDEILKLVGNEVTTIHEGGKLEEKTSCFGIYSLAENQFQLPFAITLGSILGEQQKVLLLDLQENSGISQMIQEEAQMGLEDLLAGSEEGELSQGRLCACIGHIGKVDIVYPAENSEVLCEIGARQYLRLIEKLKEELDYDAILINFGTRFQGFFEVVNRCRNLFLLKGKGGLAEWREFEFISELEKRGYSNFENRIEYVEIPISTISNSCERIVEQWKWNELGDTIRRMSGKL